MTIILLLIGIPIVLGVLAFIVIFFNMTFLDEITEMKVKASTESKALLEGLSVEEISNNEKPLSGRPSGTGDIPAAAERHLHNDGSIRDERSYSDDDVAREVYELSPQKLIFKKNEIYQIQNGKKGEKVGEFSNPKLKVLRHVTHVNDKYFLIVGDPVGAALAESYMWQAEYKSLSQQQIAEKPYYTFSIPPKVFTPQGFDGQVLVYYVGSFDFAFGGDASRPKISYIRIYNETYPQGKDIAEFGFKAGTIVNVAWKESSLVLTGDPSRPGASEKEPLPARVWKVTLPQ